MASKRLTPSVGLRSICIGLLLGIAFVSFEETILQALWLFIPMALFLFVIIIRFERRWVLFCVVAFFIIVGIWMYEMALPGSNSVIHYRQTTQFVEGTVINVRINEKSQKLRVNNLIFDDINVEDRIVIFAPIFPEYEYGDRILLKCDLQTPEPIDDFRYDRYLAGKRVYATCYSRSAPILLSKHQGNAVKGVLLQAREHIIKVNDRIFGEPHASLMIGLLLGEQRFTDAWEERFVRTGTTHIVAASGYNVAVVTFIIFALLTYFGVRRRRAFALILAAIAGYVILAGAEAAVIRAGVMGALVLVSQQLGRKSTMANVLLLTACIMLIVNPFLLRDDVGFQLSMLSTVGLIYFTPVLEKKFRFVPEMWSLRESVTATLAATLFTLPIVLLRFGRLSIISVVANVFVLPLIPYTMFFGVVAIVLGSISITLGMIVAGPAWALLYISLLIVETLSTLPFAIIEWPL